MRMKAKLLIAIACSLLGLQAVTAENAPIMWPVSYTVKTDRPFVYPLEEIGVKFDRAIMLMDVVSYPVTVKCEGVVVAEATSLEIINSKSEGILNVHFEKQNLPKGATYELCVPEAIVGWTEKDGDNQLVNAASSVEFSVPSSLGATSGTEDGERISDSNHYIVFYWDYETKAIGEPKFSLYREDEKIAELPAQVSWDWYLGQAYPVFDEYMTFDKGVNYKLVLPAGSVSSLYRDDIVNDEVVVNFVGSYTDPMLPFTYTWCSLYTDHSGVLGEVSFRYDRPIQVADGAKIQLWEIDPEHKIIMEVTPWLNTDVNCWLLMCDFGGYQRDDEWGFSIVIPEGAIISADGKDVRCAQSEFRIESAGIESVEVTATAPQPYYNLQGIKVANPKPGFLYIHNGKKVLFQQ